MAAVTADRIRNVVLVGQHGAGKTSLVEALLYRAGQRSRLGRVEDGTTVTDFAEEEQQRGMSVSLAIAPFDWKGHRVNIIDTPGYADFEGEVAAAMRVADLVLFVVAANTNIDTQTMRFWRMADELALPRLVFVNKLDTTGGDLDKVLAELHDDFGAGFAALELPIGHDVSFRGVADVLSEKAYVYDSGHAEEAAIPDDLYEQEHELHDQLVEGIVVADDELLEQYLEGEVPDFETLEHALADSVEKRKAFPVLCGAATIPIGVDRLADFICELGPPPTHHPATVEAAGDLFEVPVDASGDAVVFVYKTVTDQYVGRISMFRVLSGTVRVDDHLVNTRTGADLRMHDLFVLRGKEREPVTEVVAGDLAAVAKLDDVITGDTLAVAGRPVKAEPIEQPEPVLTIAIVPATQADDDKLSTALHRITDDDPALVVEHHPETHQTLLRGTGDTHLQLTVDRLATKFGVNVIVEELAIAYRETVTDTAEAEGRLKKQSGGHGQFGVAQILLEPTEPGAGFEFVDKVTGGAISRNYIPAVKAGIEEAMARGGEFGYPVQDVRVTLLDGKEHSVDSSEMAFRGAGRLAFREALTEAKPVLLEPVQRVEITVPMDLQGDVMGDLNARRGAIAGTTTDGVNAIVSADVPEAELKTYATQLRSITGGRGRFRSHFARYDIVPASIADKVRRTIDHDD